MKARVTVTLKSGVLDPQGKAIEGALRSLGIDARAETLLREAADKLLANTVVENYKVDVVG